MLTGCIEILIQSMVDAARASFLTATWAAPPDDASRAYYLRFTVQFAPTHQAVRVRRLQGTTGQKSLN